MLGKTKMGARQDKKRKLGRIRWRRDAVPNEVRDASLRSAGHGGGDASLSFKRRKLCGKNN
jgi:hypothetical protein